MRSLEKRKKGMGYENACLATEGRGTHFHIPYLSYVFRGNASVVPYKGSPGPSEGPQGRSWAPPRDPRGIFSSRRMNICLGVFNVVKKRTK